MSYFKNNESHTKQEVIHVYSGTTKEELSQLLHEKLLEAGYQMKEGDLGNGTYSRGNRVMRILFGAFVKYFIFQFAVYAAENNEVKVRVIKGTSGMAGGLIGVSQVKKEFARLADMLQSV